MSQYDTAALHSFLLQTPEQGLRKMLVDGKTFTDVHLNMLLKIARACNETSFGEHFVKCDYPKVKFSPAEIKMKEQFWKACETVLNSRGLLSPAVTSKAA